MIWVDFLLQQVETGNQWTPTRIDYHPCIISEPANQVCWSFENNSRISQETLENIQLKHSTETFKNKSIRSEPEETLYPKNF